MQIVKNLVMPKEARDPVVGSSRRTLAAQFLVAASIVLVAGMVIIGFWVTAEIRNGVIRNAAGSIALYMGSVVAPNVQELATSSKISPETRNKLDSIFRQSSLGHGVVSFNIWKEGGLIAYSSSTSIIGTTFPVTEDLRSAWRGEVTAEFGMPRHKEDVFGRVRDQPLLEMYVPIRERNTGRIIAVGEFYETAAGLKENLFQANLRSWLVVAGVTVAMVAALSGIVLRGSRTIEWQRGMLQRRVEDLSKLLAQNEELRARIQGSSYRAAEVNERYLRRLGADLHDGPAQSLALALLRLDSLRRRHPVEGRGQTEPNDVDEIRDALRDAITEIREICAGLTLVKLEEVSPEMILKQIVGAHESRTRTNVSLTVESVPKSLPMPFKIAIFRFVQEALNNAYRHAGGIGQEVACRYDGHDLEVEVSDRGPGFTQDAANGANGGLGLAGLRDRIESLGGTLRIVSVPGEATHLVMRCQVDNEGPMNG